MINLYVLNHQLREHQINIYAFTYKKVVNRSGTDLCKRVDEKGKHLGLLPIFYKLGSLSKPTN